MQKKVPLSELTDRMNRFREAMHLMNPNWSIAIIFSKINQYYFTGTMQEGMLIIPREGEAVLWVKRSYERALDESFFPRIQLMESLRDAVASFAKLPSEVYLETEIVPLAFYQRLIKHFPFESVQSADRAIASIRAIKSNYEQACMTKSGRIHKRVLEERIPGELKEGMSEAELAACLFSILIEEGHQGISRFGMFDTEMVLGHICFGESSLYPTYFNGPGGNYGMGAAVPLLGSRERKLKKGDLVFIDIGCGVDGYHTDKTMTYMFGKALPANVRQEHFQCVAIQHEIASMLTPGITPDEIFRKIMNRLSKDFQMNFMGFRNRKVKFLGHGIGLTVDELPVIAEGFIQPIQEGMAFAVEPKKGIEGVGMVGIENTFFVTPKGGKCITGSCEGMIPVY